MPSEPGAGDGEDLDSAWAIASFVSGLAEG